MVYLCLIVGVYLCTIKNKEMAIISIASGKQVQHHQHHRQLLAFLAFVFIALTQSTL